MATRRTHRTRGVALIYLSILMIVLCALISLGVDVARVQLAKTELQRAADASARYAMSGMRGGIATVQNNGRAAALDNKVDGSPLVLAVNDDVEFGRWDDRTRSFVRLSGSARNNANAVRVTARRTAQRGDPIPLVFASLIGIRTCDITASATAIYRRGYSLVGIDAVNLSGVGLIDSYSSAEGPYSASTARGNSIVVSNGNITLTGNPTIRGDAHPGPGGTISGGANVTGSTSPLPAPLDFPMPTVDPNYSNTAIAPYLSRGGHDLDLSGNRTYTIPSGIYSVRNIDLAGTASLVIAGDVTLYVSGDASLSGGINVASGRPGDFKIRMVRTGTTLTVGGHAALYADVYAPGSTVTIGGSGDLYGTVVGRTLSVTGRAGIHYDETVFPYGGNVSGIVLVE